MHSSRMRTARSLPYGGGRFVWETPQTETPPWTETAPGQRPLLDRDPPCEQNDTQV